MKPYYQDDSVTLYHGDCFDILPTLPMVDVLLTDPPYFKVKQDEWDNQWAKASKFLTWLGEFLDLAKPLLQPQASVWVFASPAMASNVERLVGERFRILNSIRWVKEQGWHQKTEVKLLRSYLTPWEGLIFAEQFDSESFRRSVFEPIRRYFREGRERCGVGYSEMAAKLGYVLKSDSSKGTVLFLRWEHGEVFPTAAAYAKLRSLYPMVFNREYEDLRIERENLQREYEELRRPFTVKSRVNSTDIWTFPTVSTYPGKHPCEKPGLMLRHIIEVSSKPEQTILDPFAGSGSTLEAAKSLGRKSIGIEKDMNYCRQIASRLSQESLDFREAER